MEMKVCRGYYQYLFLLSQSDFFIFYKDVEAPLKMFSKVHSDGTSRHLFLKLKVLYYSLWH